MQVLRRLGMFCLVIIIIHAKTKVLISPDTKWFLVQGRKIGTKGTHLPLNFSTLLYFKIETSMLDFVILMASFIYYVYLPQFWIVTYIPDILYLLQTCPIVLIYYKVAPLNSDYYICSL